jgi:hypothetical protein
VFTLFKKDEEGEVIPVDKTLRKEKLPWQTRKEP